MMRPAYLFILLLSISACQPSNLLDCQSEAAKMPTERGVSVARGVCHERFKEPKTEVKTSKELSYEDVFGKEPRDLLKESGKLLSDEEAFGKKTK